MKPINILHIEDDEDDVSLVNHILIEAGIVFKQTVISSRKNLLEALEGDLPDIILSDNSLPKFNSLEALDIVKKKNKNIPFILVTGNTSEEFAVSVIKAGADDYILKDRMQRLPNALLRSLTSARLSLLQINFQREASQRIRESEAKYRSFVECSVDGMLLTVTDGQILMANPAACAIFQMTEEEICSAGRFALADPSDPNLMRLITERQLTGRAQGELTLIRKDGSRFQAELTSAVFEDPSGQQRTSMIFRDISSRKNTERLLLGTTAELQHTLNIHEKIMQSSLDVICTIDEDGRFVNVSAACEKIWGFTPMKLRGKLYSDLVAEEDVEKTSQAAASIKSGIAVTNFENNYKHRNGTIVPMLWSARWDGNDKLMYCIAKDVTAKKRLEKAIEVERQRFFDLYLHAPSCMGILKGPDFVFEMANPLYLQLIDKKDIIGKKVKEVLPELADQGVFEFLDAVYQTGETFSANEMLIKFDFSGSGELVDRYLDFIYQAHRNEEGEIDGIFFFAIDVTEQVLSRRTIEASEKMFRQIVETAQEGIWMIDQENKTVFVNDKMCQILEYDEAEMLGRSDLHFLKDSDQNQRGEEGIRETYDAKFITKTGRSICTQVSTNTLHNSDGTYTGALAMITDITEKIELQVQLLNEQVNKQKQITRATLEAQEKERNYLGGELHDNINQILAAIKLQLTYSLGSSSVNRPAVQSAKENIDLAINEIRSLSHRLITHRFGEQLFVPMLENLVGQLFTPGMVKINVVCFDENIPNEIKSALYRIIQEHLNNILKHASASQVTISIGSTLTSLSVTIEDNGVGFDLRGQRNGIGLSNIYNRAESYNGKAVFLTEPGRGCKLKVVLPHS